MLIIISGVIFSLWYLLSWPVLQISLITVSGNKAISLKEISYLMKITKGENIFRLNTSRLIMDLQKNPWIKQAQLKRRLPNELLVIIKERTPLALLSMSQKEEYLIDQEGFVIDRVTKEKNPGNLIKLVPKGLAVRPKIGEKLTEPEITETLKLSDMLTRIPPWEGKELDLIEVGQELGIILRFKETNTEVRLGKSNIREKLIKSKLIHEYLEPNKDVAYIDLNFKDKVIVKYY